MEAKLYVGTARNEPDEWKPRRCEPRITNLVGSNHQRFRVYRVYPPGCSMCTFQDVQRVVCSIGSKCSLVHTKV
eukprot:7879617-Pyramimonas_sp.AAC.1